MESDRAPGLVWAACATGIRHRERETREFTRPAESCLVAWLRRGREVHLRRACTGAFPRSPPRRATNNAPRRRSPRCLRSRRGLERVAAHTPQAARRDPRAFQGRGAVGECVALGFTIHIARPFRPCFDCTCRRRGRDWRFRKCTRWGGGCSRSAAGGPIRSIYRRNRRSGRRAASRPRIASERSISAAVGWITGMIWPTAALVMLDFRETIVWTEGILNAAKISFSPQIVVASRSSLAAASLGGPPRLPAVEPLQQPRRCFQRFGAAGRGEPAEFQQVDSPLACLDIRDPAMGHFEAWWPNLAG